MSSPVTRLGELIDEVCVDRGISIDANFRNDLMQYIVKEFTPFKDAIHFGVKKWEPLEFDEKGMTKWNWMCQYHGNAKIGMADIGAFTYIQAQYGVEIADDVQIGSHCSIYSRSTVDNKHGKVTIESGARIGSHSVIMPGVTICRHALVGAFSLVKEDVPMGEFWCGVPAGRK